MTRRLRLSGSALASGGTTLKNTASILSTAYVDCCLSMGPEINAIFDALSASEETQEFKRSWRDFLVSEFRTAFAPFVNLPRRQSTALWSGYSAQPKSLTEAAGADRLTRAETIGALTRIMVTALGRGSVAACGLIICAVLAGHERPQHGGHPNFSRTSSFCPKLPAKLTLMCSVRSRG